MMLWIGILYISCIVQVNLEETQNLNEHRELRKNIDDINNDFLFNYHELKELKRNRKRKRSAIVQLPKAYGMSNKLRHFAVIQNEYPFSESNGNSFLSAFERPRVTQDTTFNNISTIKEPSLIPENDVKLLRTEGLSNDLMDVENNSDLKYETLCNMEQLVTYLAELQAINPESIVNLASEQDLDALCDKTVNGLDNIDTYLRTCSPPNEDDLYLQLIKGVRSLSDKVCFDKSFRSEYLSKSPCISQLHSEYQDCVGPTDWVEDPNSTVVCQTYKKIGECYYAKTNAGCGPETADVMESLLISVMDSAVPVKCRNGETLSKRTLGSTKEENTKYHGESSFENCVISHTCSIYMYLITIAIVVSQHTNPTLEKYLQL